MKPMVASFVLAVLLSPAVAQSNRPRPAPTPATQVSSAIARAKTLSARGRFSDAEAVLDKALEVRGSGASMDRLGNALADLHFTWGMDLEKANDWDAAIVHYFDAHRLGRALPPTNRANILDRLALALAATQDYTEAESHMDRALVLRRKAADPRKMAEALNNCGFVHIDHGRDESQAQNADDAASLFRKAIERLEEAREIHHRLAHPKGEAKSFRGLAMAYRYLNDPER